MKRNLVLVIVLTVVFLFVVNAIAQGQFATISGKVLLEDGTEIPGVAVTLTGSDGKINKTTVTSAKGIYRFITLPPGRYKLRFELEGFKTTVRKKINVKSGDHKKIDVVMGMASTQQEIVVTGKAPVLDRGRSSTKTRFSTDPFSNPPTRRGKSKTASRTRAYSSPPAYTRTDLDNEDYSRFDDNRFKKTLENALSTFSIDVDTASYANVRRMIRNRRMPEKDAVRVEEMVNYFNYNYPLPEGEHPFSIATEISACPWNTGHRLVHIGLQGKKMNKENRPTGNLVFLLDVSGSMDSPNKLPLVKAALRMLVKQLDDNDRVAIVVYAGDAGLVLSSTKGHRKEKILRAINRLYAEGSTAGGAGIQLAYKIATKNYIKNGNNRIILATDGDFNVGISSTPELVRLVEEKREQGIFLTMLGFGMGNLKDSRMEQLADKGNGNYYYIDGLLEAKKVFIDELGGTLFTIAKDVKIQVEFNPVRVKSYRLIGYVNRLLKNEDFSDDKKDAGELGAGHKVTALYEIIPAGSKEQVPEAGTLKYQETRITSDAHKSSEIMTVKLRYKPPKSGKSRLIVKAVLDSYTGLKDATDNFRFSAAVAQFALLLRESEFKGKASFGNVLALARGAKGEDHHGYRAEFIKLVEMCELMK